MNINANARMVKVMDLTDIVPADWDWFWDMLGSSNADFSFGDNNLTLIHPDRFALFIDDGFDWFSNDEDDLCSKEDWQKFIDEIRSLTKDDIYINLEA
jgi:hypothetical protein